MKIKITGNNYIAGVPSKKGNQYFRSTNPATKEKVSIQFSNASTEEIQQAGKYAEIAFKIMRNYSDEKIADFLELVAKELVNLGEQLLDVANWETALGIPRLTGERGRTCFQLQEFATYIRAGKYQNEILDEADLTRKPNSKPELRRKLIPIGPIGVFGSSNFPFAFGILGGDTASAWAAKCPVIAKGHPSHPQTSELITHAINIAIDKLQFPKGCFSLIQGDQIKPGQDLVMNSNIKAVGFTGSLRAGRALYNLGASRPNPIMVYAEMGSINPIFLMKSALQQDEESLNKLAEKLMSSVTLGVGQFCTKPGVIFVPEVENLDLFIELMRNQIEKIKPGILLNENIHDSLCHRISSLKEIKPLMIKTGGESIKDEISYDNTLFITDSRSFQEIDLLQEECFGPISFIIKSKQISDYYEIAENLDGQLSGSIIFNNSDDEESQEISNLLEILQYRVGRLIFNGVPTGVEVSKAMQHGGPYPSTTALWSTSVGTEAMLRFLRPIAFQDVPIKFLTK